MDAAEAASIADALLILTPLHSVQSAPFPLEAWWRARDNTAQPPPSAPSPVHARPLLSDDACLHRLLFEQFASARGIPAEQVDGEMRAVATSAYMQWMEARRTISEQQETIQRQNEIIRQLTIQAQTTAAPTHDIAPAEQSQVETQAAPGLNTTAEPSQEEAQKMTMTARTSHYSAAASVSAFSTHAAVAEAFSAPVISLSLVQCFLLLPEVARSMRVSRVWSVAALDPLVWADRDTSAHLAHSRRLGLCTRCSPGGFCSLLLSIPEQAWTESRLLRRCPSIHWARSHPMPAAEMLDQVSAMLPKLTGVRFERLCSAPELAAALGHPLFAHLTQLDCIIDKKSASSPPLHSAPGSTVIPEPSKHRAWRTLIRALARSCRSLAHLTIRLHECAVMLVPDLEFLCDQLADLRSLSVWSSAWCLRHLPRPMLELRSLRADFSVEQVQRLCAEPAWLPRLHTADLIIAVDADEGDLDPIRLACLSALPSLLHLTLRLRSCAIDPLRLLGAAQQRDASAFQRLRSFTCVAPVGSAGCSGERVSAASCPCGEGPDHGVPVAAEQKHEDGLDDVRAAAASKHVGAHRELHPFPNLRFVHLSCCHSRLLSDEWRLAALCAAIPNVQTSVLRLHPSSAAASAEVSFAWCECPALHSLRQLSVLIVDLPAEVTLDNFRAPMLPQLHALARLPHLICFELADVIRLNRREMQELMTLRPI